MSARPSALCIRRSAIFSEFDRQNLLYHFGNLSRIEADAKRRKAAEAQAKAQAEKECKAAEAKAAQAEGPAGEQ